MQSAAIAPPELELRFLDAGVSVERRPDASMVLRTEVPFEPSDALIDGYLRQWALVRPQQKFLPSEAPTAIVGKPSVTVKHLTRYRGWRLRSPCEDWANGARS